MKIKQFGIVIALLLTSSVIFAQSGIEEHVKTGIQHHDKGDYDKAIKAYEKALKIDSKSSLVNYEISLSYFSKGDYKKAIKYSDVVLNNNKDYMIQAYMTKGSALDLIGKTKESIKLFEKAIEETDGHYLLYYNLALNHFKMKSMADAKENAIRAIEKNPNHTSSHYLLAVIHDQQGQKVQTMLAAYYFLMLEPNTKRSGFAIDMIHSAYGDNVSIDEDKPNTINISISGDGDTKFGAAEMMVSMLEASKTLEENKDKTDEEMFVENSESFFTILGELKEEDANDIYWGFYTDFFYSLSKSDHMETYCKYITQIENDEYDTWLDNNKVKLADFSDWINDK